MDLRPAPARGDRRRLLEMTAVVVPVALVPASRWLGEGERRQRLLESGWQPARAARAVRYRSEPDA